MLDVLNSIDDQYVKAALEDQQDIFNVLMGKHPTGVPLSSAFKIRAVSSHHISRMYRSITRDRKSYFYVFLVSFSLVTSPYRYLVLCTCLLV